MEKITKAVILNAGTGTRLRPLTIDTPKCLLKVTNKTILEDQLSKLSACGINKIVIVVGYHSQLIIDFTKKTFPELEFMFIQNSDYDNTNTLYSLWLALRNSNDQSFILLNGDVLFHSEVLNILLNYPEKTCLAISKHKLGAEEVKVILHEDLVLSIGKELQPFKADGEFIGLAKFSKKVTGQLKRRLDTIVASGGSKNYFEYAINSILEQKNIYAVNISEFPSIEIDTREDLDKAKKLVIN